MAFHTRNVDVKVLNESKEIAAIIYINSIILVLIAVAELGLESNHDAYAALFGLGLLIEATLFLGFIFIPKVCEIHNEIKLFLFILRFFSCTLILMEQKYSTRLQC